MSKTFTNIAIVLGIAALAIGGYFVYSQMSSETSFKGNEQTLQNMLNNTRVFIERREILTKIDLDLELFEDERFSSLQDYSIDIQSVPAGRTDPFTSTDS